MFYNVEVYDEVTSRRRTRLFVRTGGEGSKQHGPPRDHAEKLFDAAKSDGKAKNGKADTVITSK